MYSFLQGFSHVIYLIRIKVCILFIQQSPVRDEILLNSPSKSNQVNSPEYLNHPSPKLSQTNIRKDANARQKDASAGRLIYNV